MSLDVVPTTNVNSSGLKAMVIDISNYPDPDPDPGTRVLRGLGPGTGYFILANTRPTLVSTYVRQVLARVKTDFGVASLLETPVKQPPQVNEHNLFLFLPVFA